MQTVGTTVLPEIMITHEDRDMLSLVVRQALMEGRYCEASRLADELHRARIVPARQMPSTCLPMNVPGQYLEERSGTIREVVLVTGSGRASVGMVSVLSRVGTALIGLSEGQRMSWLDPLGKSRVVRLLKVLRHAA